MNETVGPRGAELTSRFGALLRQHRLRAGITQEQLAEHSRVGVRTIRGVETGERADPRMATIRRVADALELTSEQREELLAAALSQAPRETASQTTTVPARPDPLAEAADQLAQAVRTRWQREEEQRQIHDPFPLPVRWQTASEDVTGHWANIRRLPPGGSGEPLPLTGQLNEVVDVYRRIPSGRLVVLGRAGSGKTILTLRFVLDLLAIRTPSDPVPVIFSLGSWNPTTPLRDWLISQLVRDYPGLAASSFSGTTSAAALVENGRILPVLDGFDEIAHGLHQPALKALSATTLRWLLTSRPAEYAAAVAETKVPTGAAAIELTDLTLADLTGYLPRTTRKTATGTVWDPVLSHLRDQPESPASVNLATVLTTPLMVTLARTIYSDTPDHDPVDLLDTTRFSTPEALEDHLLDNFVPTVYRHQDLERIQRWLGHLAQHLDQLHTYDLAWWRLGTTLRNTTRILLITVVTGLVNGLVNGLGSGLLEALIGGSALGLAFGFAYALVVVFGEPAREPSRVRIQIHGSARTVRRRFLPRLAVGLAGGLVIGLVLGLLGGLGVDLIGGLGAGFVGGLGVGLVGGLIGGLVWGLMAWFEAPLDLKSAVSPDDLLKANRRTVIFQLVVWESMFGLVGGLVDGLQFGLVVGLGGGLGYVLSLTAWGQWLVFSRLWLPLTGRLPWALTAFLDDAYRRGVLRQAGAVYQFRHARLQDRLRAPAGAAPAR